MNEVDIQAEIDDLSAEIEALSDHRAKLRKLLSFPLVMPVLVYWRYQQERRDDAWAGDDLEGAYRLLAEMSDNGGCSPVGVEVGGALIKMDELDERFHGRY